jgi:hypothetical protein
MSRPLQSQTLHAALLLMISLLAFLWEPVSRYSEVHYSTADLLQSFSLLKVDPGHAPYNAALSDPPTEMQPWAMFARDEFAAGRFPWWNPLSGTGAPHFANYQSAVLSPFSLLFYLFSFKLALILSAALKLFALGFLTYLFLREIRLEFVPAVFGALAFMYSGHNVLLLAYPHPGALVVLPGGCLFVERALRAALKGQRWRGELVGLAIVMVVGIFAGNPEPFYFAALLVGSYAAARLAGSWYDHRRDPGATRALRQLAIGLGLACVIAAGIGALQILPFLEYLHNSRVYEQRSSVQTPLDPRFWPLSMFPDILGTPRGPYLLGYEIPPPNYELILTAHIGALASFLAVLAVSLLGRSFHARFFWIFGVLWLGYAYNLFGVSKFFALIPTLDMAPMNRSQGDWLFCVAVLAAIVLDWIVRESRERRWIPALTLLLCAAAFASANLIGADRLIAEFSRISSPNHDKFAPFVPTHIARMGWWFALGCALAAALLVLRHARLRSLLSLGFLPLVFLPTGWRWHDYNPVCEDNMFFAVTPELAKLKARVGEERVAILGEDALPPMTNLVWRLNILPNYDALWVRDLDTLHRVVFGDTHNWRPLMKGSERALKLFGTQWLLAKWNWIGFDTGLARLPRNAEQGLLRHEIVHGRPLSQSFTCHEAGLQSVMVYLSAYPDAPDQPFRFRIVDETDGRIRHEELLSTAQIRASIYSRKQQSFPLDPKASPPGRPVVIRFARLEESVGRRYRLEIEPAENNGGTRVFGWGHELLAYSEGEARLGSDKLPGELIFDFTFNDDRFEFVEQIGDYGLYRYRSASSLFTVVGGAVEAESDSECIALLRAPTFDPKRLLVRCNYSTRGDIDAERTHLDHRKAARLVKIASSVKVYMVLNDGKSIVWIEDEATFLANKFDWKSIETIPEEEFARYTILKDDPEKVAQLGMVVVAPEEAGAAAPLVLESSPTRYRLRIERTQAGWLSISQAHYPGWVARVDGKEVPLERANYGFSAVALPKGSYELEFAYESRTIRLAIGLSLGSLIAGLLLCLLWRRS